MAQLIVKAAEGGFIIHELTGKVVTIGRMAENNIVLDDPTVSRQHAEITGEDKSYHLRDLNSADGTTVNGQPITEVDLKDGDTLRFAAVESTFKAPAATQSVEPERSRPISDEAHPATEGALSVAAEIPRRSSEDETSSQEREPEHSSFGSSLASIGKAVLAETKRDAQLAALKTKIEMARHVALPKAHYALGKRAYELKVSPDRLGSHYEEIAALEKQIEEKRAGIHAGADAKAMEKVKDAAISAEMKVEAEVLERKLKHQFLVLGRDVEAIGESSEPKDALNDLRSVKSQIEEMEKKYAGLSADHAAQRQLNDAFVSLVRDARATCQKAWMGGRNVFKRLFSRTKGLPMAIEAFKRRGIRVGLMGAKRADIPKKTPVDSPTEAPFPQRAAIRFLKLAAVAALILVGIIMIGKTVSKPRPDTSPEAENRLGVRYEKGDGVDKDEKEAVKWYRKAADQGFALAQYNLAGCYFGGTGVDKDESESVKWLKKAADQGFALAQYNLAGYYFGGTGVDKDESESVKWLKKAADQGLAEAENRLGQCYTNGEGVDKDEKEAVKWYQKAAEQGFAAAQYNLASCYFGGTGVDKDGSESVKWFKKAADQGLAEAQESLGVCYENGIGVDKDNQEAIKWFQKAADQGDVEAAQELRRIQRLQEMADMPIDSK
jgi:TPR repeat protein/pSer/pThr/pTyr-binding forkhead associated (FHA) protein